MKEYPIFEDPAVLEDLELFAQGSAHASAVLPWAELLAFEDQVRLREELRLVLTEPETTGEPLDWREVIHILCDWSEVVGWAGPLIHHEPSAAPCDGRYRVDIRTRELEALANSSPAVQRAAQEFLTQFLPAHPTAFGALPRGDLKKLKNRDLWQHDLPDGYRLRYHVDERDQVVYVVYLGPHLDGNPRGRAEGVRARIQRERYGAR